MVGHGDRPVADLRGGGHSQHMSPYGPKFSHFHAVFGKIWQNSMLAPPPQRLAPPATGNPGSAPADCKELLDVMDLSQNSISVVYSGFLQVF